MFPYFSFITNASNWKVTEYTVLMAIGGRDSDGNPVKDVYISYNMGMDWRKGGDLLMLPDYIPAMWGAQGLVYSSVVHTAGTLRIAVDAHAYTHPAPLACTGREGCRIACDTAHHRMGLPLHLSLRRICSRRQPVSQHMARGNKQADIQTATVT